ncbi:unnamed protein product [Protopolystoma xenopodis]|uniref:Uncharacterized protein n=1 Tax=Protopolystoma xenopodis TaxID=117903 RepID=A0A3S5AP98_9PLAT|nr:unnamed protein product [Protopolystoma xenopodis]
MEIRSLGVLGDGVPSSFGRQSSESIDVTKNANFSAQVSASSYPTRPYDSPRFERLRNWPDSETKANHEDVLDEVMRQNSSLWLASTSESTPSDSGLGLGLSRERFRDEDLGPVDDSLRDCECWSWQNCISNCTASKDPHFF